MFFFFAFVSGKCSHGGILDSSRHMGAKGGINKDSTSPFFSPHHYLHVEAATVATEATLAVLRDLRDSVGHETFLRQLPPTFIIIIYCMQAPASQKHYVPRVC